MLGGGLVGLEWGQAQSFTFGLAMVGGAQCARPSLPQRGGRRAVSPAQRDPAA